MLTIAGQSFGVPVSGVVSAIVRVGGNNCPVTSQTHTQLLCNLPAGQGLQQQITVTVSGQVSNTFTTFNYGPPSITGTSPAAAASTSGGSALTIAGSNFGTSATVQVDGNNCPVTSQSHTQLVCTVPVGQASSSTVAVTVITQTSSFTAMVYASPQVTSVNPTTAATGGGVLMTISGSNFGTSGSVAIGTYTCFATNNGWSHAQVICTLSAGQGASLPVIVTRSGTSSNANVLFSYNAPSRTSFSQISAHFRVNLLAIVLVGFIPISAKLWMCESTCSDIHHPSSWPDTRWDCSDYCWW